GACSHRLERTPWCSGTSTVGLAEIAAKTENRSEHPGGRPKQKEHDSPAQEERIRYLQVDERNPLGGRSEVTPRHPHGEDRQGRPHEAVDETLQEERSPTA